MSTRLAMEVAELEPGLISWTHSFMKVRQVKIVLDGETGQAHPAHTGIPQGPGFPGGANTVRYLPVGHLRWGGRGVLGIRGLSFADDIAWWAEGGEEQEVTDRLAEAAKAAIGWAENNGVEFDRGKMEAALFRRRAPSASFRVGVKDVPFNKEATRWLGVWLDSQRALKEHHAIRPKEGRKAMGRLRRLTGQMRLSPVNCRKVMTACIQSVAIFGSELWWKGDGVVGTMGRADELSYLSTSRLGRSRAVSGRPTWGHWRWS
jgi:hypothetical protein